MQGSNPYAVFARSFGQRYRLAEHNVPYVAAFVQFLRCALGPSAVFGAVRAIVINPVKRVAFWALSHVRVKVGERVNPPLTYRDPSASVVWIFLPMCRVAPTPHFNPTTCGRAIGHAVLDLLTAATFRPATAQIAPQNSSSRSANTFAKAASASVLKDGPVVHLHGRDDTPWEDLLQGSNVYV